MLPQLALAERLLTTSELGHLGDTIPRLLSVEMMLSAHPNGNGTISMTGEDIQPGALLLVNGRVIDEQGVFQNGSYVFTTDWDDNQQLQSIGILNPDGTASQLSTIKVRSASGNGNENNGNGGGHGNGNGGGKPGKAPTPHH